jgi:hypothetical protein
MPEAVSRWPLSPEAQSYLQASSVWICSEQKWQWISCALSVPLYQFFIFIQYFITDAISYNLSDWQRH